MSRANSLKKAIRQIIEHTERGMMNECFLFLIIQTNILIYFSSTTIFQSVCLSLEWHPWMLH